MGDIVPVVYDGQSLAADFAALAGNTETADDVDLLDAFLTELAGSEEAVWKLSKWSDDHDRPFFNCKAINWFQAAGYNVYRVRPLVGRLSKYRVLYAFDGPRNEFHLLAIVRKRPAPLPAGSDPSDFYDYEQSHPISRRICDDYDRAGFTKTR